MYTVFRIQLADLEKVSSSVRVICWLWSAFSSFLLSRDWQLDWETSHTVHDRLQDTQDPFMYPSWFILNHSSFQCPSNNWRSRQTSLKTQKMAHVTHTHDVYMYTLVPHLTPTAVTTWAADLECVSLRLRWSEHEINNSETQPWQSFY